MIEKNWSEMPPQESREKVLENLKEVLNTMPVCEYHPVHGGVFHRQDIVELIWLNEKGENRKIVELDQRGNWQDNLQSKREIGLAESSFMQIPEIIATNGRPDKIVYHRIDIDDRESRNVVQTEDFDFSKVESDILQQARKLDSRYMEMTLEEIGKNLPKSHIQSFNKFYKKRKGPQKGEGIKDPEGDVISEEGRQRIQDHYQNIMKKLLEEDQINNELIGYLDKKIIESRIKEIQEMTNDRVPQLSYEELYGIVMYFSVCSDDRSHDELIPNGWISESLSKSFGSSLDQSIKETFIAPKAPIFRNETKDWRSETEDDVAYIFRETTPRFTRKKEWKDGQSRAEMVFGEMYDSRHVEEFAEKELTKFVAPDKTAIEVVFNA